MIRAHVLNDNNEIVNTIMVESLGDFPDLLLVDASIGGSIGDGVVDGVVAPKPPPAPVVPQSVTRRQARQALLLAGLFDQVLDKIAAINDPIQRGLAQIEWEDSLEFVRDRPLVIQIGTALGLDSAGIDALFVQAANL